MLGNNNRLYESEISLGSRQWLSWSRNYLPFAELYHVHKSLSVMCILSRLIHFTPSISVVYLGKATRFHTHVKEQT